MPVAAHGCSVTAVIRHASVIACGRWSRLSPCRCSTTGPTRCSMVSAANRSPAVRVSGTPIGRVDGFHVALTERFEDIVSAAVAQGS